MKKIYVLTHYWDNGCEPWDDYYQRGQDSWYYSSLEMLNLNKPSADTTGRWVAEEIILDTQEKNTLWETMWKNTSFQDPYTGIIFPAKDANEQVITDVDAIEDWMHNNRSNEI